MRQADVLVMGVPSLGFRGVLEEVATHLRPWVPVLSLTKGLEVDTRMRMSEIVTEVVPGHPVGVLTGPNLAKEVLDGHAAAAVIAMDDVNVASKLQELFRAPLFRLYANEDVVGLRARRRAQERHRHRRGHGRRPRRRRQHPGRGHHPRPVGDDPARPGPRRARR